MEKDRMKGRGKGEGGRVEGNIEGLAGGGWKVSLRVERRFNISTVISNLPAAKSILKIRIFLSKSLRCNNLDTSYISKKICF